MIALTNIQGKNHGIKRKNSNLVSNYKYLNIKKNPNLIIKDRNFIHPKINKI
jgi:hypothetical protein